MQQCDLLRALNTNAPQGTLSPRAPQKHSWQGAACRHAAQLWRTPLPGHVRFRAGATCPSGGKEMKCWQEAGLCQEEPKRKPESGQVSGTYWHCKDQRQQLPANIIWFWRQLPLKANPRNPLLHLHHRLLRCTRPYIIIPSHFFPTIVNGMVFQFDQLQILPVLSVLSPPHKTVKSPHNKRKKVGSSQLWALNNHVSLIPTSEKMEPTWTKSCIMETNITMVHTITK